VVTFTNLTSGRAESWSWDFGDGSSAAKRNPSPHTYPAAGTYTVRLTAVRSGTTDSVTHAVTVP
jgi:PKD repeat protein